MTAYVALPRQHMHSILLAFANTVILLFELRTLLLEHAGRRVRRMHATFNDLSVTSWLAQLRKGRDGKRLETGLQRRLPVRGIVGRMRAWDIPFFLLIEFRIGDTKKVIARRHT